MSQDTPECTELHHLKQWFSGEHIWHEPTNNYCIATTPNLSNNILLYLNMNLRSRTRVTYSHH